MKELTIEEKAKAYDEALKRAIKHHDKDGLTLEQYETIDIIFPELKKSKESKDERIRKDIIVLIKDWWDRVNKDNISTKEQMLAWLEKQGEQKPQRMISAEAKEAMYDKPADTVEQKCEESKTKIFDAPTPFEDKLYVFVAACEFLTLPAKIEFIKEHSQELLDTAKEQIEKEETEWTKEDEHTLQGVIDEIQANKNQAPDYDLATYDRFLSWLKSLKTRYTWKPSDEQMAILYKYAEQNNYDGSILTSLYNDLKKLKLREE